MVREKASNRRNLLQANLAAKLADKDEKEDQKGKARFADTSPLPNVVDGLPDRFDRFSQAVRVGETHGRAKGVGEGGEGIRKEHPAAAGDEKGNVGRVDDERHPALGELRRLLLPQRLSRARRHFRRELLLLIPKVEVAGGEPALRDAAAYAAAAGDSERGCRTSTNTSHTRRRSTSTPTAITTYASSATLGGDEGLGRSNQEQQENCNGTYVLRQHG